MTRTTALERHLLGKVADGETIPAYGSAEFDGLDDQDPRRAASVIIAARIQRLRHHPDTIAQELRWELEQDANILRQTSIDVSRAIDWAAESRRLSWDELQGRRFQNFDEVSAQRWKRHDRQQAVRGLGGAS